MPKQGNWNLEGVKFRDPVKIERWDYLVLEQPDSPGLRNRAGDPVVYKNFIDELGRMMTQYGISVNLQGKPVDGRKIQVRPDDDKHFTAIEESFEKAKALTRPIELLIVFLPSNDNRLRSTVKYLGDRKIGIPTICIVPKKGKSAKAPRLLDLSPQFTANILLKVNAKLKGVNHVIHPTSSKVPTDTMFCGIDVCHPGKKAVQDCPSVVGFIANTDSDCAQWPASVRAQIGRQEMVSAVGNMLVERLKLWKANNNGVLPRKIMIYRDGVSTSQYAAVLQQELPGIREAIQKQYGVNLPQISLVICTKRHHRRFYPVQGTPARLTDNKTGNCRAGTVVDRGVTSEKFWSFYLQPHGVLQGELLAFQSKNRYIIDRLNYRYRENGPLRCLA